MADLAASIRQALRKGPADPADIGSPGNARNSAKRERPPKGALRWASWRERPGGD